MWWPSANPVRPRQSGDPGPRAKDAACLRLDSRFRGNARRWAAVRLLPVLALSSFLGGCFEPLYGQRTLAGGPGLQQRMGAVAVDPIRAPSGTPVARIAVELQNDLIYNFTGGGGQTGKTHTLIVTMSVQNQQLIVDVHTARPDVQQFGINASYTLTEVASGKAVVQGSTQARVSYDNPGQQQRFANARGQRDAENRAARVIADNIKARLASYFAAGT